MALNPFQKAIEDLAKSMGLKGQAQQQVYNTPQYQDLLKSFFGDISLPTGVDESQVVSRTPQSVTYKDAQGYQHTLSRDISGISPKLGSVNETGTNRPAILPLGESPNTAAITPSTQTQTSLVNTLTKSLQNPATLQQLDPTTLAMLKQISDSENALQQDQFQKAQGTTVAQLVGQGVGSSSIAGQILNQLLQGQGLVQNQLSANQANRQLGVQQYLTGVQQTQNQSLQQYIENLLGQGTQRDISGAQIGLQQQQLSQQNQQFYDQLQQQVLQYQEQAREQQRQNLINNIFKGVAAAAGIATGLPLGSMFGGGAGTTNAIPAPPTPTYFPSSTPFGGGF